MLPSGWTAAAEGHQSAGLADFNQKIPLANSSLIVICFDNLLY